MIIFFIIAHIYDKYIIIVGVRWGGGGGECYTMTRSAKCLKAQAARLHGLLKQTNINKDDKKILGIFLSLVNNFNESAVLHCPTATLLNLGPFLKPTGHIFLRYDISVSTARFIDTF